MIGAHVIIEPVLLAGAILAAGGVQTPSGFIV
jgi:hypothetical protein